MNTEIQKYVTQYEICQRNKIKNISSPGLLHPLHTPNKKWEEISMDWIEYLPMSSGKEKMMVVVDMLRKHVHFIGVTKIVFQRKQLNHFVIMSTSCTGFQRSSLLIEMLNLKKNIERICKQVGTSLNMSSSYHPQTYAQT